MTPPQTNRRTQAVSSRPRDQTRSMISQQPYHPEEDRAEWVPFRTAAAAQRRLSQTVHVPDKSFDLRVNAAPTSLPHARPNSPTRAKLIRNITDEDCPLERSQERRVISRYRPPSLYG